MIVICLCVLSLVYAKMSSRECLANRAEYFRMTKQNPLYDDGRRNGPPPCWDSELVYDPEPIPRNEDLEDEDGGTWVAAAQRRWKKLMTS